MIETKKTINEEVEEMKSLLNAMRQDIRSVGSWNYKREYFKASFTRAAIAELDGSGFINEWLKGSINSI